MSYTIKFVFHLKSGKTFECIESLSANQFLEAVKTCKESMREGIDGILCFEDCCVRLSECAVVEWEDLEVEDEQTTEES